MSKSTIKDSIHNDQIKYLKDGNKFNSSTLRFALSFLSKEEKDKKKELSDSEVIRILKTMIKRNKDSYSQFVTANRQDLADKEKKEMDLLNSYLPEVLNEDDTKRVVQNVINELEVKSIKEMGKVMGVIKKNHEDNIDMSLVSKYIKELLN
tara:strand:- start:12898 stop:13350 length:453 start_codon:yes stop_codon:yes gene_type:complete